jgi:hypothetical protein
LLLLVVDPFTPEEVVGSSGVGFVKDSVPNGSYAVLDDAAFVEVVIMVVIHGALLSYVQNVATNG